VSQRVAYTYRIGAVVSAAITGAESTWVSTLQKEERVSHETLDSKTHRRRLYQPRCCLGGPAAAGQPAIGQEIGTSASNKEVARKFIMATPTGDANAMQAVLAPNVHFRLRIAGIYSPELQAFRNGIEWNRDGLIKMQQDRAKEMKGPATAKILSMISDGDHVAAEVISQGVRAANNRQYIQHYSYHFQIRNQKIVDAHLYQDTFHEWDVWQNPGIPIDFGRPAPAPIKATPLTLVQNATPEQVAANKEAIRRWAAALPRADAEGIRAEFAPDHIWSFAIGGDYSPEMRTFPGSYHIDRENMVKLQTDMHANLQEPFTFDIYSLVGEGNEASAELVGIDVGKDGRAYRQHYSLHFKFRDGKIVEGHVYQDTLHQIDLHMLDRFVKRDKYAPIFSPVRSK
jgi:ketosteroid isomerase-like protein